MKRISILLFAFFLLAGSACETEQIVSCYPLRITRTISQGTKATAITADYKYENDLLDRIILSNYQTHYYRYDENDRVTVISRKNVQTYAKSESWLTYTDGLPSRSDEYRITLDAFTQEDSDTTLTGHRDFVYEGNKVVSEKIFEKNELGTMVLAGIKEYEYDGAGNMTKYLHLTDLEGDTIEAFSYVYDLLPNPFSSLELPFEGETHVNNVLESTDLISGDVYFHQVVYGPTNFPSQVNIKQETYLTEVIRIDYTCK